MHSHFNLKKWPEVISASNTLLSFNLKEVYKYKDLIFLFVKRDFAAQYKQTILGPLWHIIQPIFTTLIFLVLFNRIAKLPTDNIPAPIFYMTGITIWNYFSTCFISTSATFITNASIFGKVYFPRLVLPISVIISNIIRFVIQFAILCTVMLFYTLFKGYNFNIGAHILLLPIIVVLMAILGLSTGIIISSITTKYRDLHVLIGFGIQLFMYITPVAYSLDYLKNSRFYTFIRINPLSSFIEGFRYALLGKGTIHTSDIVYSICFTCIAFFLGIILFNKAEKTFMDTV